MRVFLLIALLPLAACESDFWNQPATPAPTGVSSTHNGLDSQAGGAEPDFRPKGSEATYGNPIRGY